MTGQCRTKIPAAWTDRSLQLVLARNNTKGHTPFSKMGEHSVLSFFLLREWVRRLTRSGFVSQKRTRTCYRFLYSSLCLGWSSCDFLTSGRDSSSWSPGEKQSIRNEVDLVGIWNWPETFALHFFPSLFSRVLPSRHLWVVYDWYPKRP